MTPRIVLPLVVLAASVALAAALVASREPVRPEPPAPFVPAVEVVHAERQDARLDVLSHGFVVPRTESTLVAEVPGRVAEVAPAFRAGGSFEQGDVLLELDERDLRAKAVAAEAALARAESVLAQEEVEARLARDEWDALDAEGEPDPVLLRVPQLADARAQVAAARAALGTARLDVERATLRAPFAGRVRTALVDVGQYVGVGTPLGTLYAIDAAEVRLPVRDDELRFLDLPLQYRGEAPPGDGPRVELSAEFAGTRWTWAGRVARTEGEIDPRTRSLNLVVVVDDPYARDGDSGRPPLAAGMFVEALVVGRAVRDVVVLPRAAVRPDDSVWVVDEHDVLHVRPVTWLRTERERVLLVSGVEAGERVVTSALEVVSDGMPVLVASRDAAEDRP
ncbi:MAG: efflux RND transporter periplasmic adaptor subunit [Planctomycetes bacterium]|nr:efflux RND transporter periplasmic adaptor subunit [Planctomycetota bacterium]